MREDEFCGTCGEGVAWGYRTTCEECKGKIAKKLCPQCNTDLQVLLFMGVEPDGYVCSTCKIFFDLETLKPLAHVIGAGE